MSLSERQENILAFIREFAEEHGFPPTIREIGKAVGISSTSLAKYNLERLEEKGKLERSDEISRGLRLKDSVPMIEEASAAPTPADHPQARPDPQPALPIPAVGQQENPFGDDVLVLTQDLVPASGDLYACRSRAIR